MTERIRRRRKLGPLVHDPIDQLAADQWMDSLIFIEKSHAAALKTRAAALMYIIRRDLGLTTVVRGNEVRIYKEKDFEGASNTVDLREV